MMLDKKQIQEIFLLRSNWVIKPQRQHATSTKHLSQELLMDVQCSDGSRSLAKETRALKMKITVPSHQKLTTTN